MIEKNIFEKGIKEGIFGTIKDKEIDRIEYDRWMGGTTRARKDYI